MKILYCGDDEIASLYILGALESLGHSASHVFPSEPFPGLHGEDLLILSDYRAEKINPTQSELVIEYVSHGGQFLMLGGWDSFNGLGKNYYGHPLSSILPVELESTDDRRNMPQGLVIRRSDHVDLEPALSRSEPPVICGYNAASAKKSAQVIIDMSPVRSDGRDIKLGGPIPLVITQSYEKGNVTACLTDLAPHWSGGLVDWGRDRVTLSTGREVGSDYPSFLKLLLEI
jgi:uncharacterized membrane protein